MAKNRAVHLPPIEGSDRAAQKFYLVGAQGEKLIPVRMKDLKTGRVAFRLSEAGPGCTSKARAVEVEDEATAYMMVASGKYSIRAQREIDRGPTIVRLGGRAVRELVVLDSSIQKSA